MKITEIETFAVRHFVHGLLPVALILIDVHARFTEIAARRVATLLASPVDDEASLGAAR
ncbi:MULTISPECIES: hypothetical protein [Mesorhizobium]|uniref:hypothetical protein n=1 Tax=Mesorhizobium TaxID=68287 RepID=UPI001459FF66|nr:MULTISPECIES: hypothetical protein [Mesorhizobium]